MRKKLWKRTTFLFTLWSAGILSYIVIANQSNSFLTTLAPILGSIILAYIGGEKASQYKHGIEMENGSMYNGAGKIGGGQ